MMFAKSNWITKLFFKLALYLSLLLVLIYVILTSVAPFVAVRYAEHWFAEQHPGQAFTLHSVEISPLRGRVILKDLKLHQSEQGTIEQLKSVSLGELQLHWQPMALFDQQVLAELQVSDLALKAYNAPAIGFEQFSLTGIDATEQTQAVKQLTLKGLVVRGVEEESTKTNAEPLLQLNQYQIDDIRFDAQQLQLMTGVQNYNGLVVQLTKLADGVIQGVPVAPAAETTPVEETAPGAETAAAEGQETDEAPVTDEAQATDETQTADSEITSGDKADVIANAIPEDASVSEAESEAEKAVEKTFSVQIAGLQQSDGPESYVHFIDQSVTPAADVRLAIRSINIGAVDSAQLQQKIPLQIELGLDEYNRIVASGEMGLLNNQPEGDIELHIEQLNLVPFNGYVAQAMGYHVQKGALKLDVDLAIRNAEMDGEADILLRNSEFLPVDEETIDRLGKQISMPVDTVLSILRDDNNNIKLTMPLSGNINDPDVGLDDLMNQLSMLALKEAATYYLKQALQPYGTLISLSTYAGDYLFAIRLDDLTYQPLESKVNDDQAQYLEKVAEMMVEKETLELQVCGFASEAEVKTLAEKAAEASSGKAPTWQQLAQQRSGNIKAWFKVQHQELLPRVTTCQPQKGEEAVVVMGF
ncbi:DUF748 domain-containing protein [Bacterioplanoides sp.]|uniref:DUF748 domain-containing protein n=1 Tax=Bacterioplanoides sp. TaxID=2066072 RepID=UPI003B5A3220